jgi:hypothetical protein
MKKPKLVQLDRMLYSALYKWFTTMHSTGKPMTGPMVIKKAKSFEDGMKITDRCTWGQ